MLEHRELTERVIGLKIEVHRIIGPGRLESVYSECLCMELEQAGIAFESEVMVPVMYKTRAIPLGFRADILVANAVIIEIKATAALVPAHEAQILTTSA